MLLKTARLRPWLTPRRSRRRRPLRPRAIYDAIVVGLGAAGSAALYRSAKASLKVLGLEQFQVGHSYGSSHGRERVFRVLHPQLGCDYTSLAVQASKLWEELEEDAHEKILHRCGVLNIGQFATELEAQAKEFSLDCQSMTVPEMNEMFPGLQAKAESLPVVLDFSGGFLKADRVLQQNISIAKKMNATVHQGEKMIQWAADGSGVRVETNKNVYYAQALVLCSGPWIAEHVPQLKTVCQVERQVTGVYVSKPAEQFTFERLPAFLIIHDDPSKGKLYGTPSYEDQGMKLGRFNHLLEVVDPNAVDHSVNDQDRAMMQTTLQSMFRPEQHRLSSTSVCLFTNSPDEDFIIDRHPIHPQVIFCSACSGMGFKFGAALGEILCRMAIEDLEEKTKKLIEPLRLNRPALHAVLPFE